MLKYLGELGASVDARIKKAVALSVPCDLAGSAKKLEHWQNRVYMARFLKKLRVKVREKSKRFPGQISVKGLDAMRSFAEFDQAYTAPIHGFKNADEYWAKSSCREVLGQIALPCLLINAQDDPFLTPECYPREAAAMNPHFELEIPRYGGHLGFVDFKDGINYWSERRTVAFLGGPISEHA